MIKVIKIIYVYDGHKDVEKPEYLTFADKEQMEAYRKHLLETSCAINIFFTYEEY